MIKRLIEQTPAEVSVYQGYLADWAGGEAYRDWWFEYPPGLLMLAKTPTYFSNNPEMYFITWLVMIAVCLIITHLFLGKKAKWITLSAFVGGILATHRFDIFVVFLVAWGLEANKRNKTFWSAVLLTLGAFTKIYPAIPLLLLFLFKSKKHWFRLIVGSLIVAIPMLAWWLPGIPRFLEFHGAKHAQIESVSVPKQRGKVIYEKFSWVFKDTKSDKIKQLTFIAIGLIGIISLRLSNKRNYEVACFLGVLTFILFGNIFSPQYMLWLSSFLPWMPSAFNMIVISLTYLTNFYFINYYDAIIQQLKPELYLLQFRNSALIVIQLFTSLVSSISSLTAVVKRGKVK